MTEDQTGQLEAGDLVYLSFSLRRVFPPALKTSESLIRSCVRLYR